MRAKSSLDTVARQDFFLVHVEGGFYGLIQFLDLAGVA
jgi:hypothetical protein